MKQDNRGASLIEILVAITILVICAIPLFKSMILSSKMNAKSRILLAATNTAEAIMEDIKSDGMEEFIEENSGSDEIEGIEYIEEDGKKIGYSFVYPEYEMDQQKFWVKVSVKPYKNTDDESKDYNKKDIANLYRMNKATDAIYTQNMDDASDDIMKAVADNHLAIEQKEEVLENLNIDYYYDIVVEEESQCVNQTITYSYNEMVLGTHESQIYDSNMEIGNLYSLYIFFEPKNRSIITINNPSDYPLDVYLIKQGENSNITVQLLGSEAMQNFGKNQDPDFTKGIRLRTNFYADNVFFYEPGKEGSLSKGELQEYFNLVPLDDKNNSYRLYDVEVEVLKDDKKITDLTGTVVR